MPEIRILCNNKINHIPESKNILKSIGRVTYQEYGYEELLSIIHRYDILVPSLDVTLDGTLLCRAKRLQLIATPSTGTDHIDLKEAKKLKIAVISLKDEYAFLKNVSATAELAFGLLLSLVRKIPFAFDSVQDGLWNSRDFCGNELSGKTLGIIGYGRLGEKVSRYARAFDMSVLACDPYRKIEDSWVRQVRLPKLLEKSDIISIHVHLNDETCGMLSHREFTHMKPGAYIINTSRGAVIDENALIKALKSGKVSGAAVDVLTDELKKNTGNDPLVRYARKACNLIITPHLGGVTVESQQKVYTFMAKRIRNYILNKNMPCYLGNSKR